MHLHTALIALAALASAARAEFYLRITAPCDDDLRDATRARTSVQARALGANAWAFEYHAIGMCFPTPLNGSRFPASAGETVSYTVFKAPPVADKTRLEQLECSDARCANCTTVARGEELLVPDSADGGADTCALTGRGVIVRDMRESNPLLWHLDNNELLHEEFSTRTHTGECLAGTPRFLHRITPVATDCAFLSRALGVTARFAVRETHVVGRAFFREDSSSPSGLLSRLRRPRSPSSRPECRGAGVVFQNTSLTELHRRFAAGGKPQATGDEQGTKALLSNVGTLVSGEELGGLTGQESRYIAKLLHASSSASMGGEPAQGDQQPPQHKTSIGRRIFSADGPLHKQGTPENPLQSVGRRVGALFGAGDAGPADGVCRRAYVAAVAQGVSGQTAAAAVGRSSSSARSARRASPSLVLLPFVLYMAL